MIGASRKMLRPLHNCPAHTIEELFQDAERRRIILLPTMFCRNIPSNPLRSLFRNESIFGISTRVLQKLENYVTEIVQSLLKNHHNVCSKQFCMQHMLASCSISSICLANFFRSFKEKGGNSFFHFPSFVILFPQKIVYYYNILLWCFLSDVIISRLVSSIEIQNQLLANKKKNRQVPPRLELGSLDSESKVLTITPWDLGCSL